MWELLSSNIEFGLHEAALQSLFFCNQAHIIGKQCNNTLCTYHTQTGPIYDKVPMFVWVQWHCPFCNLSRVCYATLSQLLQALYLWGVGYDSKSFMPKICHQTQLTSIEYYSLTFSLSSRFPLVHLLYHRSAVSVLPLVYLQPETVYQRYWFTGKPKKLLLDNHNKVWRISLRPSSWIRLLSAHLTRM